MKSHLLSIIVFLSLLFFNQCTNDTPQKFLNSGVTKYNNKDFDGALTDFSKAIELDTNYQTAYYNRGMTYFVTQRYGESILDFKKAIYLNPLDKAAYYKLSDSYEQIQDYESLLENCNTALKYFPQCDTFLNNKGICNLRLGNIKDAITDFTKAIELNSNYISAIHCRGTAFYLFNKYDSALVDLTKVIELDSNYSNAYSVRGSVYNKLNNKKKACLDWEHAASLGSSIARDSLDLNCK
jgi:tetratricopeptide (TPR) repeat protein